MISWSNTGLHCPWADGNVEGLGASTPREIENVVVSGNSHSPKIGRLPFPAGITVTGTVYMKIYKISPDLVGIIKCTLETRSGTRSRPSLFGNDSKRDGCR